MKLRALSHYDNDLDTRYGDCIILHDLRYLIVYDCGHEKHAETVEKFLQTNSFISQIFIVVSHNDSDHTDGVCNLLKWLYNSKKYSVCVFSHQYLKHVDTILDKVDDGRRNRESLKEALLKEFDNIKTIIETAKYYGFTVNEALKGENIGSCIIVGPTEDQFTEVAAKAVDDRENDKIGKGNAEETVMNAASVQLMCKLENAANILLCGDASPSFICNLNNYDIIQLPHHGQLADAKAIFERLGGNAYDKEYLISDNTGSGETSGGSEDLVQYMMDENYSQAMNTKNAPVYIPSGNVGSFSIKKQQGVKLGGMDFKR